VTTAGGQFRSYASAQVISIQDNHIWIRAASNGPKKGPRSEIPDQSGRLARPASQRNPKNKLHDDSERQSERQSEKLTFSDFIDARIGKESDRE